MRVVIAGRSVLKREGLARLLAEDGFDASARPTTTTSTALRKVGILLLTARVEREDAAALFAGGPLQASATCSRTT